MRFIIYSYKIPSANSRTIDICNLVNTPAQSTGFTDKRIVLKFVFISYACKRMISYRHHFLHDSGADILNKFDSSRSKANGNICSVILSIMS